MTFTLFKNNTADLSINVSKYNTKQYTDLAPLPVQKQSIFFRKVSNFQKYYTSLLHENSVSAFSEINLENLTKKIPNFYEKVNRSTSLKFQNMFSKSKILQLEMDSLDQSFVEYLERLIMTWAKLEQKHNKKSSLKVFKRYLANNRNLFS